LLSLEVFHFGLQMAVGDPVSSYGISVS
jgi:hypothetical protein